LDPAIFPQEADRLTPTKGHEMTQSGPPSPDTSDMMAVHKVFRTSLGSAGDLLDSAGDDNRGRVELIANYYDNVLAFLDVHHQGEDLLVFPLLVERAPTDLQGRIDTIAGQHTDVHELLDAAKAAVAAFSATPNDNTRRAAADALASLDRTLVAHLDQEEEFIVPLAADYLSMEEWGALPGHGMANFGGDKIWLILGLIRENMTQEQRDQMLAHMPPPAVDMWQNMGNGAFDAMMADVRQTS
jgi:hemerythrin-like domain-containing protein